MAVLFYSIWEINEIIVTAATIPYAGAEDDAALNAGVERIKGAVLYPTFLSDHRPVAPPGRNTTERISA